MGRFDNHGRLDFIIFSLLEVFSHFEIENGSRHCLNQDLASIHVLLELFLSLLFIIDGPSIIREPLFL